MLPKSRIFAIKGEHGKRRHKTALWLCQRHSCKAPWQAGLCLPGTAVCSHPSHAFRATQKLSRSLGSGVSWLCPVTAPELGVLGEGRLGSVFAATGEWLGLVASWRLRGCSFFSNCLPCQGKLFAPGQTWCHFQIKVHCWRLKSEFCTSVTAFQLEVQWIILLPLPLPGREWIDYLGFGPSAKNRSFLLKERLVIVRLDPAHRVGLFRCVRRRRVERIQQGKMFCALGRKPYSRQEEKAKELFTLLITEKVSEE